MRELKRLEAMRSVLETIHLALISCCLSIPLLFAVPEYPDEIELLWALGAALPVLALHLCDRHTASKKILISVALALLAVSMLICRTTILRVVYGLLLVIQLGICTLLARPGGKPALSVPKFYHGIAPLLLYALAQALKNDVMITAAVTVVVLFVVVFLLHTQATRLRNEICDQSEGTVFEQGIVRLNVRLMTLFCVVGALVVIGVPFLLSLRTPAEAQPPVMTNPYVEAFKTPPATSEEPLNKITLPEGTPINTEPMTDAMLALFGLFAVVAVGLAVFGFIFLLRSLSNDKERHSSPQQNGFIIETLAEKPQQSEAVDGGGRSWSKRIRRLYQRLIHARADKNTPLQALTPQELERAAALEGAAKDTLHALYEKARYSGETCDKSDYLAAKSAANLLKKGESG